MLALDTDYDAYHGWYFVRTTAASYDANGDVRDELMAWLYGAFCAVIPDCGGDPGPEIVAM